MVVDPTTLLGRDGARRSSEVVLVSGRSSVVRWVRSGRLLRPFPGVLVDPARAQDWRVRAAAAVLWSGGRLTGRSALHLADLLGEPGPRVHIGVPPSRHVAVTRPPWLVVHVRRELSGLVRRGLAVVDDVAALLDAWGFAHGSRGTAREVEVARSTVIGAIRRRRVDPAFLVAALELNTRLPGRAELLHLVELAGSGSHSEFEIWGLQHLFDIPGLPPVERQYALETAIGTIHLDGALPRARLGIELDGAAYHRSPDNWAGDRRRDAAALALDWATLRIDFRRAHEAPAAARAEIAAAYWARLSRIERPRAVI
ncbi:hypothetical protein SAMN03159343_3799 [Klenkia marina]|uniref:Transcriptional regulator, AbiEi antitoxin, Type IV TA system n=1 Tax=Klenkia marina TaxID=1960309 RepID=A0A1G4YYR6_9ACTN|nr:hypothetical protein [Klenkia marina]SCX58597.1 hypothetical protein SAMN03159343_3799 [Klenkia marina]